MLALEEVRPWVVKYLLNSYSMLIGANVISRCLSECWKYHRGNWCFFHDLASSGDLWTLKLAQWAKISPETKDNRGNDYMRYASIHSDFNKDFVSFCISNNLIKPSGTNPFLLTALGHGKIDCLTEMFASGSLSKSSFTGRNSPTNLTESIKNVSSTVKCII